MGAFYGSILIKGATSGEILRTVRAMQRNAFVIEVQPEETLVYDQAIQGFDNAEGLASFAVAISQKLPVSVIGALNHDDDLLGLSLIQDGGEVDFYISNPELLDEEGGEWGVAAAWCSALNVPWLEAELGELFESDAFTFESERHAAIARLFGWPDAVVGYSFDQLKDGERPDGFADAQIHRIAQPDG